MPSFARRLQKIRQTVSKLVKKCARHFASRLRCSRTLIESSVRRSHLALPPKRNTVPLQLKTFLTKLGLGARIVPSGLPSPGEFCSRSRVSASGFLTRRLERDLFLQWWKSFSQQSGARRRSLSPMMPLTVPDSNLLCSLLLYHQTRLSLLARIRKPQPPQMPHRRLAAQQTTKTRLEHRQHNLEQWPQVRPIIQTAIPVLTPAPPQRSPLNRHQVKTTQQPPQQNRIRSSRANLA